MRPAPFTFRTFRFPTPIAGVRVGLIDGRYVVNPTYAEIRESKLNLIVAGTEEAIVMVEAGARGSFRSHHGRSLDVGTQGNQPPVPLAERALQGPRHREASG